MSVSFFHRPRRSGAGEGLSRTSAQISRLILSQILGFGEAEADRFAEFQATWNFPQSRQAELAQRFGEAGLAELGQLARETDAELFQEGLLSLAARMESQGRHEAALRIYSCLAEYSEARPPLRERARTQMNAIVGVGALGPRAEFLMRNLAREATEPSSLLALGVAGMAFRLTRLAALGRLAASPASNALTRGFGARALASLAGFSVEAPAFTLVGRFGAEALGRRQDWSGSAIRRDLASSFLTLGSLKLAGWASRGLLQRVHGFEPVTGFTARLFPQVGMLGGILLGHRLEEGLGLRERRDGATTLVDSLALLLQFHVAGRLSSQALGPRFAGWERSLDLQTETIAARNSPGGGAPRLPAFATAGMLAVEANRETTLPLAMMTMMGGGDGDGKGRPSTRPPVRDTLAGIGPVGPAATSPAAKRYSLATNPYRWLGADPTHPLLVLEGPRLDPNVRIAEALSAYYRDGNRSPVVVTFGGDAPLDGRSIDFLGIDIQNLFAKGDLPRDTHVTVIDPRVNLAVRYGFKGLFLEKTRLALEPAAEGGSAGGGVARRAVSESTMPSPPDARSVPTEPRVLAVTGAGSRSARDTKPDSIRAVRLAPKVDKINESTWEASIPEALGDAVRQALSLDSRASSNFLLVQVKEGAISDPHLRAMASALGTGGLNPQQKLVLSWNSEGGGRWTLQRRGELIAATGKSYRGGERALFFVPSEADGGFVLAPENSLRFHGFESYSAFESNADLRIRRLATEMLGEKGAAVAGGAAEGAAWRGEVLARLITEGIRLYEQAGRKSSDRLVNQFREIQALVEKSYLWLDLETVIRIRERLGGPRGRVYRSILEQVNALPRGTGETPAVFLGDLPTDLPGYPLIPHTSPLRSLLLQRIFHHPDTRAYLEVAPLLKNPQLLGNYYAEIFSGVFQTFSRSYDRVQQANYFDQGVEGFLGMPEGKLVGVEREWRKELGVMFSAAPDIGRIFSVNGGNFQRSFLRSMMLGKTPLFQTYRETFERIQKMTPEFRRSRHLDAWPRPETVETFLRGSRPSIP